MDLSQPRDIKRKKLRVYLAALAAAGIVPITVFGILAQFNFADNHSAVLAVAVSALLAFAFGFRWPNRGWRWGVWVAGGFALLLILAFVGLYNLGRYEAGPLLEALGVTVAACAAAEAGSRLALLRTSRASSRIARS
jgi:peptidoglycan/LPS O-acetylase OafA/YrhL